MSRFMSYRFVDDNMRLVYDKLHYARALKTRSKNRNSSYKKVCTLGLLNIDVKTRRSFIRNQIFKVNFFMNVSRGLQRQEYLQTDMYQS